MSEATDRLDRHEHVWGHDNGGRAGVSVSVSVWLRWIDVRVSVEPNLLFGYNAYPGSWQVFCGPLMVGVQ